MAKKKRASNGINKTQAVLEYSLNHPDAKPKEIAEELTKLHGVEFTSSGVSTTRHQLKQRGALPGGTAKRRKKRAGGRQEKVGLDDLMAARQMAEQLGGVERTRQILDALVQLR